MTGAHDSLPLGTVIRVANFETGRMVDVRINDRKRADATLVHLSRAAANHIGLSGNQAARGSILVIGSMAPMQTPPAVSPVRSTVGTSVDAPARKRFAPFSKGQQDPLLKAVNEPGNAIAQSPSSSRPFTPERRGLFGGRKPVQYGIPAGQYEPPVMAQNTANGGAPGQGLVPLSAGSRIPPQGNGSAARANVAPSAQAPGVTAPLYRVQFGAFRRAANASEFNAGLIQSGIATTVLQSRANDLYLVVTSGGFRTADEAQRWIHHEGTRRGWRERPVVIR